MTSRTPRTPHHATDTTHHTPHTTHHTTHTTQTTHTTTHNHTPQWGVPHTIRSHLAQDVAGVPGWRLGSVSLSALSSAFTSLGLHSDCFVAAMFSPRVFAFFWSPSAGNGVAFDAGAKFEILCGQGVLWVTLVLLCSMLTFPVPCESSTSWFGVVSGTNPSFVCYVVLMAATLLAALDGLAHGLCPSLGLARVGPAFPWLKFTFSILFLVVLVALFLVCVDVAHLLSGKGYVHKEDKAFWKDFGMAGKACSLEDPFLTTGPFAVVTAAASSAAVGKYVKFAAAASCSALILSITLDSGFCEFVNLFWCGIVVALSLSEGEDSVLLLRILTLVRVFNNTALGITTLSQGQVDLHRGVVRPWGKSLPHMQQPHSAGALRELVLAWRRAAALGYMFTLVDAFLLVVIIAIAFVGSWQQAAAARGGVSHCLLGEGDTTGGRE